MVTVTSTVKVSGTSEITLSFDTTTDAMRAQTGNSKFVQIGDLRYAYDPAGTALTTGDGRTWAPISDALADHFLVNTIPGTTDVEVGMGLAMAWSAATGRPIDLRPGVTYYIGSSDTMPAGATIRGNGATILINGTFNLSANCSVRDVLFRQASPGAEAVTLASLNVDGLDLRRVKVDLNGDGTNGGATLGTIGAIQTCFGMKLDGGTGHYIEKPEGYGSDSATVLAFWNLDGTSQIIAPYAHDLACENDNATDDNIQPIDIYLCDDIDVFRPRVHDVQVTISAVTTTNNNRAITVHGCNRVRLVEPNVDTCGQGVDFTGSDGNYDCEVINLKAANCYSFPLKFANLTSRCRAIGGYARDCGGGVTDSSNFDSAQVWRDRNQVIGFKAVRCGQNNAINSANPGFSKTPGARTYKGHLEWVDCIATDDQGAPVMENGFYNEVTSSHVVATNCESFGHTTNAFNGVHEFTCQLALSGAQTIPHNTSTPILWNSETADTTGMHDNSSNTDRVTLRRDGNYSFDVLIRFATNTSGTRQVILYKNGSQVDVAQAPAGATSGIYLRLNYTSQLAIAGDYFSVSVYQSSGGDLDVSASDTKVIAQKVG